MADTLLVTDALRHSYKLSTRDAILRRDKRYQRRLGYHHAQEPAIAPRSLHGRLRDEVRAGPTQRR